MGVYVYAYVCMRVCGLSCVGVGVGAASDCVCVDLSCVNGRRWGGATSLYNVWVCIHLHVSACMVYKGGVYVDSRV